MGKKDGNSKIIIKNILNYSNNIIDIIHEPFLVLNKDLHVVSVNQSFYSKFKIPKKEIIDYKIDEIGNRQWDIPELLTLLKDILPEKKIVKDYKIEHKFEHLGKRILLLNAYRIRVPGEKKSLKEELIMLAIEDITKRQQKQEVLEESEERYRRAFETSKDGLLLVHKEKGDILETNESAQDLLGYSEAEFSEKKLWEVGVTENPEDFKAMMKSLERDGIYNYNDTTVKTKEDTEIAADVFLVDRAKVAQCNIRDITERKKNEENILEIKNELLEILQGVAIPTFVIDKNHRVLHWNKACERLTKISAQEIEGTNEQWKPFYNKKRPCLADLIVDDASEKEIAKYYKDKYKKSSLMENAYEAEYFFPDFGREGKWLNFTAAPLVNSDGEKIGAIETLKDISDRKKKEEELKKTRKELQKTVSRYQQLCNNINSCVAVYKAVEDGEDFIFVEFNKAAERADQIEREEVIGKKVTKVFPAVEEFGLLKLLKKVYKTGEPESHPITEYSDERISGWRENYIYKLSSGEIVVVYEDITKRKQAQKELQESKERLEKMINEAPFPIMLHADDGEVLKINKIWTEITGYKLEEISTISKWAKKAYSNKMSEVKQVIDKLHKKKGRSSDGVFEIKTKSGEKRVWDFMSTNLENLPGGRNIVLSMAQDITEKIQAEERYRNLFKESPVGIWEEDFSQVKDKIDKLKEKGVDNIGVYLDNNPEFVRELTKDVEIISVNNAVLEMYKAKSVEGFKEGLSQIFGEKSISSFKDILKQIAKGETTYQTDKIDKRLDGEDIHIYLKWFVADGYEDTYSKVIVTTVDITNRKQAEKELRRNENKYKSLFYETPLGSFWYDEHGIITECNDNFVEIIGSSRDALVGLDMIDDLKDADLIEAVRSSLNEGEGYYEGEYASVTADKNTPIRVIFKGMRDEDGKIYAGMGLVEDITKRKQAEKKLRESERKYRSIFEQFQDLYYRTDMNGIIEEVSPSVKPLSGYEREELIGSSVENFYSNPEERKQFLSELKKNGHVKNYEIKIKKKNGEEGVAAANSHIIFGKDGEPESVVGTLRDITDRKQTETYRNMVRDILDVLNKPDEIEEAIQSVLSILKTQTGVDAAGLRLQDGEDYPYFVQEGFSRDFLRTENTLLECGTDGGVCRDKDGNVSLECTCGLVLSGKTDPSNPLFTEGGSAWTNDALPILDLPSAEDPRHNPRNKCIHQGYASIVLIPIRTKDRIVGLIQLNDKRKGRFTLATIEILEGVAAHIGEALMRKQAKKEKEELQNQLLQSQKMEAVGNLTGGIAHDFNNIITAIKVRAQLLLEENVSDEVNSELKEIDESSNRARDLTKQLLQFSRKGTDPKEIINLNTVVKNTFKMLKRTIPENIDIVTVLEEDLWQIKAAPSTMEQVIMNLTINARDAMPNGGEINIKTQNVEISYDDLPIPEMKPGKYVKLYVRDNGEGMAEETKDRIFDPFFTTKTAAEGTGMGLSVVYGVVKNCEGDIKVETTLGAGTLFNIFLPAVKGQGKQSEEAKAEVKANKKSLCEGLDMLVIEDEQQVRKTVCRILMKMGFNIHAAGTVQEAEAIFKEKKEDIDIIFTDVILPDGNGIEVAKKLKELKTNLQIVATSGYLADKVSPEDISEENFKFIEKPFNIKKIREIFTDLAEEIKNS